MAAAQLQRASVLSVWAHSLCAPPPPCCTHLALQRHEVERGGAGGHQHLVHILRGQGHGRRSREGGWVANPPPFSPVCTPRLNPAAA